MRLTVRYVLASLCYLVVGITLAALAFTGFISFNVTAFYFMQLYGFVAMMIFGLSYLFIPAFSHAFLHSLRLARVQFWLANIGTISLTTAMSGLIPHEYARWIIPSGFVFQILAIYAHAYNIVMTLYQWKKSPGRRLAEEK